MEERKVCKLIQLSPCPPEYFEFYNYLIPMKGFKQINNLDKCLFCGGGKRKIGKYNVDRMKQNWFDWFNFFLFLKQSISSEAQNIDKHNK